jgi:hypothetical protein
MANVRTLIKRTNHEGRDVGTQVGTYKPQNRILMFGMRIKAKWAITRSPKYRRVSKQSNITWHTIEWWGWNVLRSLWYLPQTPNIPQPQ